MFAFAFFSQEVTKGQPLIMAILYGAETVVPVPGENLEAVVSLHVFET